MGVPAFFYWLSRKYSSIVVRCIEELPRQVQENGETIEIPIDTSQPNPNKMEFDNLYVDMNGIIHPCCHPEGKPPPNNEDEMMLLILEYIDRLFSIVRPRRLLYLAMDGVAPRAKMNQQRSRRFRTSKKNGETANNNNEALQLDGKQVPHAKPAKKPFDSNCITPGTEFMFRLADCLRYYVHVRLNTDPGWANVAVILSDANAPGEGEHKVMEFIRRQRAQPDHDPNTRHCFCGADADLIMLGLATHEVNFTIIRNEIKSNRPPIYQNDIQQAKEFSKVSKEKEGALDEVTKPTEHTNLIFVDLSVLREHLYRDLSIPNLPFEQDLERAIDDWVLMCFFAGNEFLPHLPSLEIREGCIGRLISLYKKIVRKTGDYLTDNGVLNLSSVQLILTDLGEMEDEIFKNRREYDLETKRRVTWMRKQEKQMSNIDYNQSVAGRQCAVVAHSETTEEIETMNSTSQIGNEEEKKTATVKEDKMAATFFKPKFEELCGSQKRKCIDEDKNEEKIIDLEDDVKLWETGWKERYYEEKFKVTAEDFRTKVANEYIKGICWVLKYYYQGCASWKWYFPYHYAPFASDFVCIGELDVQFEADTIPFRPLEQLMSVFPATSNENLPPSWRSLMTDPKSPVIDFYPTSFRVDLNGRKYANQGVTLLPFVDEVLLLKTLEGVYQNLTQCEIQRNTRSADRLFVSHRYPAHDFLEALYEQHSSVDHMEINPKLTLGMCGEVWCDDLVITTGEVVISIIPQLKDYPNNNAISVHYEPPRYKPGFVFQARLIKNAKVPIPTLKLKHFYRQNTEQSCVPLIPLTYKTNLSWRSGMNMNDSTVEPQIEASHIPSLKWNSGLTYREVDANPGVGNGSRENDDKAGGNLSNRIGGGVNCFDSGRDGVSYESKRISRGADGALLGRYDGSSGCVPPPRLKSESYWNLGASGGVRCGSNNRGVDRASQGGSVGGIDCGDGSSSSSSNWRHSNKNNSNNNNNNNNGNNSGHRETRDIRNESLEQRNPPGYHNASRQSFKRDSPQAEYSRASPGQEGHECSEAQQERSSRETERSAPRDKRGASPDREWHKRPTS